jgi:hypothetical protein
VRSSPGGLEPAFRGRIVHVSSVLQEGRENANIDAGLGFHLENLGLTAKSTLTVGHLS